MAITNSAGVVIDNARASAITVLSNAYDGQYDISAFPVQVRARVTISSPTTFKLRLRSTIPGVLSVGGRDLTGSIPGDESSEKFYGVRYGQ